MCETDSPLRLHRTKRRARAKLLAFVIRWLREFDALSEDDLSPILTEANELQRCDSNELEDLEAECRFSRKVTT